jgi:hypothetical protein
MSRANGIPLLFALWALIWLGSILVPMFQPPTGDGFTRGLNRIGTFVGFQIAAGVIGIMILALRPATGPFRRLSVLPIAMAGALIVALTALLLWARLSKPDPVEPQPITQPTTDAVPVPKQQEWE